MNIIIRGYADGQLLFEERLQYTDPEELTPIAERQLARLLPFERHMIELELLDAPTNERFLRFGTDTRRMVQPIEIDLGRKPFVLPSHCADCGAVLMGGATRHKPGCAFQALIDQAFGKVN